MTKLYKMDNCTTCQEQLNEQLSVLPSTWREKIVDFVCGYMTRQQTTLDCDDVKECLENSTTALTEFTVENGTVCISFTNNEGATVERCFSFTEIINRTLDDLDPLCLAAPEEWIEMSYQERWQSIIDRVCETCEDPTITTTTSTTTTTSSTTTTTSTSSTTTTTTLAPLPEDCSVIIAAIATPVPTTTTTSSTTTSTTNAE